MHAVEVVIIWYMNKVFKWTRPCALLLTSNHRVYSKPVARF